jgi:hypothetical protein
MSLYIFIRTVVLGPLFSAITYVVALSLLDYFSGAKPSVGGADFIGVLYMVIIAAYLMVFIPSFGFLPGIIPLVIYSFLLAYFSGKVFLFLSKHDTATAVKLFAAAIVGVMLGFVVYGGFYSLALLLEKEAKFEFIWVVLVPTSAIFGAWAGLSYVRKGYNKSVPFLMRVD